MNKYFAMFVYLLVGGYVAGGCDRIRVDRCDKHIPLADIVLISVAYPVLIVAGLNTKKTINESCEK